MGYNTEELIERAVGLLQNEKLNIMFIMQLCAYMGVSRQAFYDHGLDKNDKIKELIENNKVRTWSGQLKRWYNSDNATLQLALFKSIVPDEILMRVSNQTVINNNLNKIELTKEQERELIKQMLRDNPDIIKELNSGE